MYQPYDNINKMNVKAETQPFFLRSSPPDETIFSTPKFGDAYTRSSVINYNPMAQDLRKDLKSKLPCDKCGKILSLGYLKTKRHKCKAANKKKSQINTHSDHNKLPNANITEPAIAQQSLNMANTVAKAQNLAIIKQLEAINPPVSAIINQSDQQKVQASILPPMQVVPPLRLSLPKNDTGTALLANNDMDISKDIEFIEFKPTLSQRTTKHLPADTNCESLVQRFLDNPNVKMDVKITTDSHGRPIYDLKIRQKKWHAKEDVHS